MTPREALIEILAGAEDDAPGLAECLIQDLAERGLVLVPREPTEAMYEAVQCDGEKKNWASGQAWRVGWKLMVNAASK